MRYLLITLFLLAVSGPAWADSDAEAVRKAEAYLYELDTAQADFIQRTSAGGRLSGKFYLDRPGKLRFQYNEVKDFIVADGLFIYFYDSELGEQSNAPIGQTLADFILREDLTFDGDLQVTRVAREGDMSAITLTQRDDPGAGSVELFFTDVPYQLRKWKVTDATGAVTEIELKDFVASVDLPYSLFTYHDPNRGVERYNE